LYHSNSGSLVTTSRKVNFYKLFYSAYAKKLPTHKFRFRSWKSNLLPLGPRK